MIYVLYGTDSFSQTEALRTIKAELDADGTLSANTTILDAREVSPRDVFAACDTVSLFGGPRLVILRGAPAQSAGARGRGRRAAGTTDGSELSPRARKAPGGPLLTTPPTCLNRLPWC